MSECKHEFVDAGAWMSSCRLCGMLELQKQLGAANERVEELGQEIALLKEHREIDKALIRGDYKKVDWKGRIIKDLEAELRWLKSIYPNHPEYEPPADELTRLGQEMGEYD